MDRGPWTGKMLISFILYGIFGWCAEIVWTAGQDVAGALASGRSIDWKLQGHTYLWMFPIYGAAGLLFEATHAAVHAWPWVARGTTYMLGCFAVEYVTGWLIQRSTGVIPWDYSDRRWHVHGLIRLDYIPVWFLFGLLLEHVQVVVESVSRMA